MGTKYRSKQHFVDVQKSQHFQPGDAIPEDTADERIKYWLKDDLIEEGAAIPRKKSKVAPPDDEEAAPVDEGTDGNGNKKRK